MPGERPWLCQDPACPAARHDDWRGWNAGCRSGAALSGHNTRERDARAGEVPSLRDATGTRRRLQALIALGFSLPVLSERSGLAARQLARIVHGQRWVTAFTAEAVHTEAWIELGETDPPTDWRADRRRRDAAKAGYLPPPAWDPATIDDPAARPFAHVERVDEVAVQALRNGTRTWEQVSRLDQEHAVVGLRDWYTLEAIAALLRAPEKDVKTIVDTYTQRLRRRERAAAAAGAVGTGAAA